ncbi:MAG: hypothetical protein ABSE69_08705 [Roseiarcus sp.]
MVEGDDRAVPASAVGDTDLPPRAFLVGFGAAQRDDHALPDALDVGEIEADQFGPPEPARAFEIVARRWTNVATLHNFATAH